ncbi:GGDEF domain-containing protein [Phaeospirillum tilakii]|uniref:diguanylate cyclase n=1 Tax=Phaeospirillum tilakii TaxID=741673 RepID=A0ABW5C4K9_9PROT
MLASLLCWLLARRGTTLAGQHRLALLWAALTIPACAVLVTPHSEPALLILFVLPLIYYLLLPLRFAWAVGCGAACSLATLAGYVAVTPPSQADLGVALGVVTVNVVLALALVGANRAHRQEWAALASERAARQELAEHREMLNQLLLAVPAPLLILALPEGSLIRANRAAFDYFGPAAGGSGTVEGALARRDLTRLAALLRRHGHVTGFETHLALADGQRRDVLLDVTVAPLGQRRAALAVVVDITERKRMERTLQRLALTDPLTGLANRTRFFAAAAAEIRRSRRYGHPLAVVMIDIDFFKRINDGFGHDAGDRALRGFAGLCRALVRDQDLAARIGGEEFALLLPETAPPDALALAERLRAATEAGQGLDGLPPMTVSLGLSSLRPGETAIDPALSRADQALYQAKRGGRNRVVCADPPRPERSQA